MKFRHRATQAILWLSLAAFTACTPSRPSDFAQAKWLTNAEQAINTARQQGRPLLIAFLGSDWSVASQQSQKDVLDTVAFKDFADANLVLLKVDFSRKDTSPELLKAYAQLAKGLQVDHFPIFFLADPANGVGPFQRLNTTGFAGPMDFVGQITAILAQYRSQLAAQQAQAQSRPMSSPAGPQPMAAPAAGNSGFPSPDQLLHQSQGQPSAPPNAAPAAGADTSLIHLK